jgi:hypothetical protein
VKLVAAGDQIGVQKLVDTDQVRLISPKTQALVITKSREWYEVRVLDGKYAGDALYIHPEFVKHPPSSAELAEDERKRKASEQREADRLAEEKRKAAENEVARLQGIEDARREKLAAQLQADEDKAADLLKAARRWLDGSLGERDEKLAQARIDELLRRFPNSQAAGEARKLLPLKSKK